MEAAENTIRCDPAAVLDHLPEAVISLDQDGHITYINSAARQFTGYERRELLGRPLHFFYGENDESIKTSYELGMAVKQGRFVSTGWRKTKSGNVWCEVSISPQYRANTVTGFNCIFIDRGSAIAKLMELRRSEQMHRLMVDSVKDYAIFMLDATGHIMTWNEGAQRTKGYLPAEIIGKHFSIFYTAADLAINKPENELRIATETGRYEEEGWRIKKNGSLFWANVVITALFNDENKLIGFGKVTRDLTERREKEEEVRQSEERYRMLVEQVLDYGIFMMDHKGRIVSWNEGAARISGYPPAEVLGRHFSLFYPEEDLVSGKPAYELQVAIREGKYEEEGWRVRRDGTRFWANVVITAIYNAQGIHVGFSKVTRDLTERKQAERALRESHDQYRQLSEKLRMANEELSYTNSELEQFTSIVSHDLQEPVRTIRSFLQLAGKRLTQGNTQDMAVYISKSVSAASRMHDLIRNLLSYSQLSKNDLLKEPVSAETVVYEAIANLRSLIDLQQADIAVTVEVNELLGDRIQLVQLLQNLLSNAMKFVEHKKPRITISAHTEGHFAVFAITDNGIGISPHEKYKVFDMFRRLHTETEYPGTGIGLTICKKIVDRHGGRIWLESEKGKGSTFYFTIPVA